MRPIAALLLLAGLTIFGCHRQAAPATTEEVQTIRFWHFWSEPDQRRQLQKIVDAFETEHPSIHVELTDLQWADGRAKLQLAFNAGTAPDVLHLGLDWYAQYADAGVLAVLPDSMLHAGLHPALRPALYWKTRLYAMPWTMNARAHVQWPDTYDIPHPWGLCTSDPHNVVKRNLPLLWKFGAPGLYASYPVSATLDEHCVAALDSLRLVASGAIVDRSRQLDESFMREEFRHLYTGMWMLPAFERTPRSALLQVHADTSILNADVLCVSRQSETSQAVRTFLAFVTQAAQVRHLQDAGYACSTPDVDTTAQAGRLRQGFARTVLASKPLPVHPRLLAIEPIIEDMISQCMAAKSTQHVRMIVEAARRSVLLEERR